MHPRNPAIGVVLLLVSGCAALPSGYPATVATFGEGAAAPRYMEEVITPIERDPEVVCRYVARSGSRIQERVCRSRERVASDHAKAVSALLRMNGGGGANYVVIESDY